MYTPYSYTRALAISPSDSANLPIVDGGFPHARGLFVGTAGTLKIQTSGGDTVTFASVPAGHVYVEAVKVFATGTSATGIVALY